MATFNSCTFIGNLVRDVELKYVGANSTPCANTAIAVNDKYKKGDEVVETVCFVDCVMWSRTAEIASEYLTKGSPVLVSGKLKQETWEKDGQKHSKHVLTVETLQMLGSKKDGDSPTPKQQQQPKPQQSRQPQKQAPVIKDEDISF